VQLAGKVAIVTGAGGGGSGQAEALRLGREGVSVVVNEINETGGRETVRLIEANAGRVMIWWKGQPPRTMRASRPKSEWLTSPSIAAASYP
jgi:NAD(P)-dependent dehydrogenase (short-subunit alcohol dehydrogenase family)